MKTTKTIMKFLAIAVASCLMLGAAGCSLLDNVEKDKVLDAYNDVIQFAGKATLTSKELCKKLKKHLYQMLNDHPNLKKAWLCFDHDILA